MEKYGYYTSVFIPKFIYYKKDEFPGYPFVSTITINNNTGHILKGPHSYFLCIRSTDYVSTDVVWGKPLGFERGTIKELQDLMETFKDDKPVPKIYTTTPQKHRNSKSEWRDVVFVHKHTGQTIEYDSVRRTSGYFNLSHDVFRKKLLAKVSEIGDYDVHWP